MIMILALSVFACQNADSSKTDSEDTGAASEDGSVNISSNGIEVESDDGSVSINLSDALETAGADKDVEVVNFRKLKELLPESLGGLPRTDINGETAGAMGFKVSNAEATYEQDGKSLGVEISDLAGMGGMMQGVVNWASLEIDRETDDEYERTTTIDGHKAFEEYNSKRKTGNISVIVDERFVVKVSGDGVASEDIQSALKKIDLDRLRKLK